MGQTAVDAQDKAEALRRQVVDRFGAAPEDVRVVRSPYRVCPLGAHIDHQLGPVTAMAVNRSVLLAYAPSRTRELRVDSLEFPGRLQFRLDHVPGRARDWADIPRGVAAMLGARHRLDRGVVGILTGKLHGGGVSSSAAVGVTFLLALQDVNGLALPPEETIELSRRVENEYLGLNSGILDPAAILLSRRDHLTRIDCRTSRHDRIGAARAAAPFKILLIFSGLTRPLVGTDYNRRVGECAEAARTLLAAAGRDAPRPVLGEVTADEYDAFRHHLRAAPARRAAHFFSEVERVSQGVAAWRQGDLAGFGRLVTASGESSVHNYECGNPPLIGLFQDLVATDGVYGARFSGAGFRGCCVALVDPDAARDAAARVSAAHARRYPDLAAGVSTVLCDSDDGAGFLHASDHENGRNGHGAET